MVTAKKAKVTLNDIALAGVGPVVWKFQTGSQPYTTSFSVYTDTWERSLRGRIGQPLPLEVTDSRGVTTTIKDVYILHELPSDGPKRTSFLVADRRWKWAYKLIARDYNMPKKTGDRTALNKVPVEQQITIDKYEYRPYSLDGDQKWTPKRAVLDVLEMLEGSADPGGGKGKKGKPPKKPFVVESFPIETAKSDGEYSLQNIVLRDQGDVALSRLLSYIPGAEVYVDAGGQVRVFDGTDLRATADYFKALPPVTWDGDKAATIDRTQIRPEEVIIHYQREVEVVLDYKDDYSGQTSAQPFRDAPYLENVLPTVDTETEIIGSYEPETDSITTKKVPPGTWVQLDIWLDAMDKIKPAGSLDWNFGTIQRHWLKGDLDGVLGGRGLDLDPVGNVSLRIQALKQHFRQTFQINRRYVERVRDIQAIRVALLDPVTGARAPAAVWGQACSIPTTKGKLMANRKDPDKAKVFRNVDYLAPSKAVGTRLIQTAPGPARVNMLDRDLGIFRLEWLASPYATIESWVPCHLVQEGSRSVPKSITRNLAMQDDSSVGAGMKVEAGTNGIFLRDTMELRVMLTIVPAAPNNKRQFHRLHVRGDEIKNLFRTEFGISGGSGPALEVFILPGEATARFGWDIDADATSTVGRLLGLDNDDPDTAGIDDTELPGYIVANEENELSGHSRAVAAELLAVFADSLQGRGSSVVPKTGLQLKGNMASATIQVAASPSAKVSAVHEFPGQQKPISRLALMPEATRHIVLGIVPFGKGDK